jgi:hypothetical protein
MVPNGPPTLIIRFLQLPSPAKLTILSVQLATEQARAKGNRRKRHTSARITSGPILGGSDMARPTIAELEAILQREEEVEIEILPNGEVRAKGKSTAQELGGRKPLTMRENLGGEYTERSM